jgi:hypothetical protein
MNKISSLAGGVAGAAALTLIHELARKKIPDAPRMDKMGMEATSKLISKAGWQPPSRKNLYFTAMAGDLISNSLYFSKVGAKDKKNIWINGAMLGLAAGLSAVYLPGKMGLNEENSNATTKTKIMTVGLYVIGGLVAAAATSVFQRKPKAEKFKQKLKRAV